MENPPGLCSNVCSCTVSEKPPPALVETTRSWQPKKKVLAGKRLPKATSVGVVSMAVTVAPSSAVQLSAATLATLKDKLSATATCTLTPKFIETRILPDPLNVPPTKILYV